MNNELNAENNDARAKKTLKGMTPYFNWVEDRMMDEHWDWETDVLLFTSEKEDSELSQLIEKSEDEIQWRREYLLRGLGNVLLRTDVFPTTDQALGVAKVEYENWSPVLLYKLEKQATRMPTAMEESGAGSWWKEVHFNYTEFYLELKKIHDSRNYR